MFISCLSSAVFDVVALYFPAGNHRWCAGLHYLPRGMSVCMCLYMFDQSIETDVSQGSRFKVQDLLVILQHRVARRNASCNPFMLQKKKKFNVNIS